MAKAKRQYNNDYPSVTQVLDVLRKHGLEAWFKMNTLEFINAESTKGKLIGTQIHDAIQSHIEAQEVKVETEYAEEVMNVLKGFMLFRREHLEIKLHKSEILMTSEVHKVNGTMDCLGEIDGVQVVFDWKSGVAKDKDKPSIYPEYITQVSAYTKIYNEINGTNINRAFILSLAKDKVAYNLEELTSQQIEDNFNEVFLPALKILTYQKRKDK